MCMIEEAEPWDFYSGEIKRKAARDHRCEECGRTIAKGETYEIAKGVSAGRWSTFKTCEHCLAARSWLLRVCSGWMFGYVGGELREHWDEEAEYRSLWLGRAIIGMRRGWKQPGGSLMPVMAEFPGLLPHERVAA